MHGQRRELILAWEFAILVRHHAENLPLQQPFSKNSYLSIDYDASVSNISFI